MRKLAIRRPAFLRILDAHALFVAPFHDASAMMVADAQSYSTSDNGFSPRYRISTSETDPFMAPDHGATGGELYQFVTRWTEITFSNNPNEPLFIWDTQASPKLRPDGSPIHLMRKFTYPLNAPSGHSRRNAIAEGN